MSEKLDRKGMRKECQALMHRFVISVRVLFNANLIKGRILVIALLHSSNLAFPFGSQPKICLPFSVLQATSCNLLHAHTQTHARTHTHIHFSPSLPERTRHWPA